MKTVSFHRSRSGLPAFSQVEVMTVIGVMGFIVASLAGVFNQLASRQYPKDAAIQFQAMVREASSLARREQTPVRIAFILPETAAALKSAGLKDEGDRPVAGCRLLVFRVPAKDLPLVALCPTGSEDDESVPVSRIPRFPSLVGEWSAPPARPHWMRWHKSMRLTGDRPDRFKAGGFTGAAADFQYQPVATWAEKRNKEERLDPFSVYPEHFNRSPYQIRHVLKTGELPSGGERPDRRHGKPVP